jgi:RND family efflux transporter MFP subunit
MLTFLYGGACMMAGAAMLHFGTGMLSREAKPAGALAINSLSGAPVLAAQRDASGAGLNVSGYVTARVKTTVSAEATGRLIKLHVKEGDKVVGGQLLAELKSDSELARFRLLQSQAESVALNARRDVLLAENQKVLLRRNEELRSAGMISAAAIEQSREQLAVAENQRARSLLEIDQARFNQSLAKTAYEATFVRAPFSGTVIALNAQLGEIVSPLASSGFIRSGICTIVDLSSQVVEFDVGEKYIGELRLGQPLTGNLDAYPDSTFKARITAIAAEVDRAKGTIRVRAEFDRIDERTRPDMSVRLTIPRKQS